ncbi:hypothetical protein [Agrobacterium bohemicum]|uniref:hypothetical protein n=1 Tax=Agrobacterium bohemicum TaxID=2052828 RepID=UPI001AEC8FD0|nr:hypothetical protein [Agrobacterium bohemicum]
MVIEQAMGVARRQGTIAEAFLAAFVERLKLDEFVERALKRHRVEGVAVATVARF